MDEFNALSAEQERQQEQPQQEQPQQEQPSRRGDKPPGVDPKWVQRSKLSFALPPLCRHRATVHALRIFMRLRAGWGW